MTTASPVATAVPPATRLVPPAAVPPATREVPPAAVPPATRGSPVTAATLWQPRSPCGPACLPAPDETARVAVPVRAGRLLALLGVLVAATLLAPVMVLARRRARHAVTGVLARGVLRALGVRLTVRGRLPRRRALLVANHVSWLDAVAVLAVAPARMLAKREVRRWPLIGALAVAAGAIFVDRRRPRALPATVAEVAGALRADAVVAVFPEGTTFCGAERGGYRPAMFQAAVDAGTPVVPVTLAYHEGGTAGGTTAVPAFLGDDSLWTSVRRVLAVRGLVVSVAAARPLHLEPATCRRRLARAAEATVRLAASTS